MTNIMATRNSPRSHIKPGTDQNAARMWNMGNQRKNLINTFSYATIVVSMASMSGLALGYVTEKSMHPRLSAAPPSDPVDRFGLGQNAYQTANVNIAPTRAESPGYADASYEIGRYINGARVLAPFEPARKAERLRLERLQAWNDQNFGDNVDLNDEDLHYAVMISEDHQPIDVGAVKESPEPVTRYAVSYDAIDDSGIRQNNIIPDVRRISDQNATMISRPLNETDS